MKSISFQIVSGVVLSLLLVMFSSNTSFSQSEAFAVKDSSGKPLLNLQNDGSVAIGSGAQASGVSSAMGLDCNATGAKSIAIGEYSTANGTFSVALGLAANTNGHVGSFVYGDNSNPQYTSVLSSADNQFMVRAAGGYVFYTSGAGDQKTWVGATLGPNQTSWSVISDSTRKENFLPVNGESILRKISKFNLRSWNYKGQNPKKYRHYGPMAQVFFKAFGHDKIGTIGNDTTINSGDFMGINLIAIQALEKRTEKLQNELNGKIKMITALNNDITTIKSFDTKLKKEFIKCLNVNQNLNTRLQKIENILNKTSDTKVLISEK